MAVEVAITGNGVYAGARSSIAEYRVVEDSTPVEISDSSGGTGQISFTADEDPSRFGSALLLNDNVTLTDGDRGVTEGKINEVSSNNGVMSVTADSRLGRLVIDVTADPVHTTFSDAMIYYLGLGGILTGIAIDPTIGAIAVNAPGWSGDLWTKIKQLCVTYGAEITLLRTNVAVRPIRQRRALEINNVSEEWTISNRDLAKRIEVRYYNSAWKVNALVYPKGGWTEDIPIYAVDIGQTVKVNIPIDVSLTAVTQPTAFGQVPQFYGGPSCTYALVGNDNNSINAASWVAGGGSLTVAIGGDGASLDVTIIGPTTGDVLQFAPYRVASGDGEGTFWSSLRVIGTGIHYDQQSIIVPTGADETATSRDIGVTVDNLFISTEAQARSLALDAAARWATPRREIRMTKSSINRPGETDQNYDYATFAQFDAYAAANSITTFAQFDTAWAGDTFADFDAYWYDLVDDTFDYQVFGNANGARVAWRRAMWRIRSVTIGATDVQYTAEEDTTFGDFDASATGMTFAQFDTSFSGLTFADFALIPLPNVPSQYDRF